MFNEFIFKKIGFTKITSDAVSPGQQCEPQHGVAETQHHTKHVQEADHFRGGCADQHCTDHKAQKGKYLGAGGGHTYRNITQQTVT